MAHVCWRGFARVRVSIAGVLPVAVFALLGLAGTEHSQAEQIKFVETKDLRVLYYDPSESFLVPSLTQNLLAALDAQRRLFGYEPAEKLSVLLQDFADVSNASAQVMPHNRLFVSVAPQFDPYEYVSAGIPYASLSSHESTHIATLDKANSHDARYRRWFRGKVDVDSSHPESLLAYYLTTPRNTSPRWYPEGSAVFTETWMMGGLGRAQGGYDEMVFRSMVREGARFYDPLGLVSKGTEVDFRSGANAYLYGTRFMNYLAYTYDPVYLLNWWRRDDAGRRNYADDFARVFGKSIPEAWSEWIQWERGFQDKNLKSVSEHPITSTKDVTQEVLGAVSRTFLSPDEKSLYAAVKYPGQVSSLVSISRETGAVTRLHEIRVPFGLRVTSLAYDPVAGSLFFTENNETYRNLEVFDLKTRKARTLLVGARIGDISFNAADRSLWGVRFNNGLAMLVRIPFPYKDWKAVKVFKLGDRPFDVDVSPDGALLSVSVARAGKSLAQPIVEVHVLRTEELAKGVFEDFKLFTMEGAVPEGFVFSKDGRYLYGSSYFTGVSNIYRYELETEKLDAVTNTDIGFFTPRPVDDAHLIVLRYTVKGFVPTLIDVSPTEDMSAVTFLGEQVSARHPQVHDWKQAPAASIPFESAVIRRGIYRPMKELHLESMLPVVQGYKQAVGLGIASRFSDPMGFDSINVEASYSPDSQLSAKERAHVAVDFHHGQWTVGAKWNGADFYDLFGPTKRSREGYSGYVSYDRPIVFDPPETLDFVAKVAYFGGLDRLPGFQNVTSPSSTLSTVDIGFEGSNLRASPGAVDSEAGHSWSLVAHSYGAAGEIIPSVQFQYNVGLPLPLDHSSLWLRTGAVVSEGHLTSPLSNTYLGGFGNNYVDNAMNGGAQRYRSLTSLPGFDIDALSGRRLVKTTLEWSLPPVRFESLGSPGFYINWARPEIFASFLSANPDDRLARQTAGDLGVQMDFNLQIMHRLSMLLSIGAAKGFGGGGLGKTEFMLSLQVL